jgi:hypothetical protein
MTRFARTTAAATLVLAGLWLATSDEPQAQSAAAQSTAAQQRQLLLITEVHLKPDTAPEWTELQKAEQVPAQKKGGVAWRDTWTDGPGGDPYLRGTVVPISSLAQFDNPAPIVKALGAEGAAAFGAKNRRLVTGSRSRIYATRPDLGFGTRTGVPKLAILTTVNVVNGRGPDFDAFLKSDVVPALKKAGVTYYAVAQVVYGGDTNEYVTLVLASDYAELAKGHPLERALGPEGAAKLAQKTGAFVSRLERRIIRYVPELSFAPGAPTSH